MELAHGIRRDRYHYHRGDQEEQADQEAYKNPSFSPSPSTPPSFSLTWIPHAEPAALPIEREHMFDKVVTPSDVGKLNRLVIPKQYAEKFFPLDPSVADKGLSLCFEDRTGKPWQFRYSYWNSSQSYVMTKGWSRFVKDKRLDAGDTVSFCRGVGDSGHGRFFIDWQRRPGTPHGHHRLPLPRPPMQLPFAATTTPFPGLLPPSVPAAAMRNAASPISGGDGGSYVCFRSVCPPPHVRVQVSGGGVVGLPMVLGSVPVIHASAEPKRLRLFGVNLECSVPEDLGEAQRLPLVQPKPPLLQWRIGAVGALESTVVSTGSKLHSSMDLHL